MTGIREGRSFLGCGDSNEEYRGVSAVGCTQPLVTLDCLTIGCEQS